MNPTDRSTMNDHDSTEVSDSTDWLTTPLPGLAEVESALRCQVCKDFFKTPMLTSCNHTFCSLCIRRALSNDGRCPLCRANEQEIRLRSNWSMEEVVASFVKARPIVLEFVHTPPMPVVHSVEAPKRSLENGADESREPKRLRSSARLSATRGAQATAEIARQEAEVFVQDGERTDVDDGLVACPICLKRMKEVEVDRHLDKSCPGSPLPETQRRPSLKDKSILMNGYQSVIQQSTPTKRPDRLPTVNYSSFKEAQLRKKLAELGISTLGDRKLLERRHKEWMTIWNANCDALQPRKKTDLLQDLNAWENTQGSRAPTASRSVNLGAQIKDKDFDQHAWSMRHESSFRDLIANARRNVAKGKQNATAGTSTSGTQDPSGLSSQEQHHTTSRTLLPEATRGSRGEPIRSYDEERLETNTRAMGKTGGTTGASERQPVDTNPTLDRLARQMS